jgi:hypothetical protein
MKAAFVLPVVGLCLGFARPAFAQGPGDAAPPQVAKPASALEALRKSDYATADNLLQTAAVGNRGTAAWHLSYAEQLMAAAIDLQDHNDLKRSTDYFHRAAVEMEGALAAADAPAASPAKANVLQTLGFIARIADGDITKANAYFKQALAMDAGNAAARAALQRTKAGRKELEEMEGKAGTKGGG